ncbi:COMT [Symbiodinium pilosum]|uniref:COMT protein n=1 Tax=Symbiodinium pilosum TaxID=2952 RepID=A0A812K4I1_SYMPI|nr:COMT [Symbiodinium pilosum]
MANQHGSDVHHSISGQLAVIMYRRLTVMKYIGELLWILSEAGWILLIPQVCIPASFLAFVFIFAAAALDCLTGRMEVWIPSALQALWLFWNFVWMLDEVFWDEPDQQTPWALTPMLGKDEKLYKAVQEYCKIGFFLAPVLWMAAILLRLAQSGHEARSKSSVQELICHAGYIAMWSSTDGFWACGYFWPATVTSVVTLIMIAASTVDDCSRMTDHMDRTDVVWMLWTLSNYTWILLELSFKDWLPCRYLATMICLQSLALLAVSWPQFRLREEEEDVNGEPGSAQWPDELAASLRKADSLLHVG